MKVRKINIEDLPVLLEIGVETFYNTYAEKNTEAEIRRYLDFNFNPERIKAEILHPESEWYFAEKRNNVVGYLKINTGQAQTENKDDNSLEVERIYVRKAFHGQKIGKALMDHAVERAKEQNVESVWLGVWEENPKAIAFYERYGFQRDGVHMFNFAGENQVDLLMRLDL